MVRKAIAPNYLLEYVQSLGQDAKCVFGLVLGQPADEKDYILHFARTPLNTELDTTDNVITVSQIPDLSVAEHAMHTTRMLPGGMYVLGLFFITEESIFKPMNKKLITILQHVQSKLGNTPWMFGNHANSNERIILHFNNKSGLTYEARTLNINSGTTNPINFAFSEKDLQWCQLECKFDFNDIMKPVSKENYAVTLKNQLKTITGSLSTSLKSAIFIFDGQLVSPSDMLDCNSKSNKSKKNIKMSPDVSEDHKVINVTLLLPTTSKMMNQAEITDNAGSVRIIGHIASSVWLNPSTTFEVASRAIIEDIVRSFQSRLTMHFDSLTEGEGGVLNDTCSLHEPPRRVQIPLPHGHVTLSDYLFPGEGAQEAQMSFQDVLDVQIPNKHAIKDIEGQADLSGYYNDIASRDSNDLPLPNLPTDTNKFMYIVGAGVATLVLVISLLIHFLREHNII